MFSKFIIENLQPQTFCQAGERLKRIGESIFSDFRNQISGSIEEYLNPNGHIDANTLRDAWFPKVEADVFISHSHANRDLALMLAGFLKENFDLNAFIDSTIWGNIAELQQKIDQPLLDPFTHTYNYEKRNQSTAYVHILLSTALTKMMDNCEALFFLSTDQSLSYQSTTSSVWIYHELFTANFLRINVPQRFSTQTRGFSDGGKTQFMLNEAYSFDFEVDLTDFKRLRGSQLCQWKREFLNSPQTHALDVLYKTFEIK